jgi:hypothetical protein
LLNSFNEPEMRQRTAAVQDAIARFGRIPAAPQALEYGSPLTPFDRPYPKLAPEVAGFHHPIPHVHGGFHNRDGGLHEPRSARCRMLVVLERTEGPPVLRFDTTAHDIPLHQVQSRLHEHRIARGEPLPGVWPRKFPTEVLASRPEKGSTAPRRKVQLQRFAKCRRR